MSVIDEVLDRGATGIARAIQGREVSCAEVMAATLARIDRFNPRHTAIVALRDPEVLMAEARAADAARSAVSTPGSLYGLPLAVKDHEPVAGVTTTWGSPIFRDVVPAADSLLVERLRGAGGIVIGKTNVPEFTLGGHTYNPVYGRTGNAYDPTRSAGGSSGGAAVALALGMLAIADGSDFGGSLRTPAGWNNVYGFRPSFGRVPTAGLDVWTPGLSVSGPMARSVEDLALLYRVMARADDRAPLAAGDELGPLRAVGPCRIAWGGDLGGAIPFEPGVLDLCRRAVGVFETFGCTVEEAFPVFPFERLWACWTALRAWQAGGNLVDHALDPARRKLLKPEALFEAEEFERLPVEALRQALRIRTEWYETVRRFMLRYDALVLPTAQLFPFPLDWDWPKTVGGRTMERYYDWMSIVVPVSLAGCPVVAAPAGFGPQGLPMGIQIMGRPRGEAALLALVEAYDAATRWPETRPAGADTRGAGVGR